MEFIASREFRINPGKVWKKLKQFRRLVVTSNGKPVAVMKDVSGKDLEEEMRAQALVDFGMTVSKLRAQAKERGAAKLTSKEIEAEITAVRKSRK